MGKKTDETYDLIEEMANNSYQWSSERSMPRRIVAVYEIDAMTALNAKVDNLFKKINQLNINSVQSCVQVCEICASPHVTNEC